MNNKKVNISTALGATFTWYDFIIFNIATALIFPKLFFPEMGFLIPMLVFAVGFLARPLGGAIFGMIGDRFGRKLTLVLTLYVTGFSTVFIGLLPTYAEIGIVSTILLVVARILQTAAVGGEWGAASSMLVEHNATTQKKSFIASFVNSGFGFANIMAALSFFLVFSVGIEYFGEHAWRIPFLLSGILLVVGVYIRKQVLETPEFLNNKYNNQLESNPIKQIFVNHYKAIIAGALAIALAASWASIIMVFGVSYMVQNNLVIRTEITQIQLMAWFLISAALVFFGWLSDKIDKTKILMFGAICSLILTWPVFLLINDGHAALAMLSLILLIGPAMAVAPSLFCELFPSNVRQTGSSVSYNIGLIVSGIVIILAQQILNSTQSIMPVAILLLCLTAMSIVSSFYLNKITNK